MQHSFLYTSLPLFSTTTTWNFQKRLSDMFYEGNVIHVICHFFLLPLIFTLHWWLIMFSTEIRVVCSYPDHFLRLVAFSLFHSEWKGEADWIYLVFQVFPPGKGLSWSHQSQNWWSSRYWQLFPMTLRGMICNRILDGSAIAAMAQPFKGVGGSSSEGRATRSLWMTVLNVIGLVNANPFRVRWWKM